MDCFATVSRLEHESLFLVSKLHRSLMLSRELYQARSLMGCTELCIYLYMFKYPFRPVARRFAFYPKALNHPRRLVPIRPHLYQPPEASSVVAHGCGIYVIGGMIARKRSSKVFFLDCRFHTWTNLPCMGLGRASTAAGVVDGKIYVFGGCKEPHSHKWVEVFDPKTHTWHALQTNRCPQASELESGVMKWRQVMGLEDLRDTLCASKLVNYGWALPSKHLDAMLPGHKLSNCGPNMLLFWDCLANWKWEIWCAEISLQRRKKACEIWATVEWSEAVTTIDRPLRHPVHHCKILYSLSFNI
ncbi:hypothetical protein Bca4012_043595 [Brassica carinata]